MRKSAEHDQQREKITTEVVPSSTDGSQRVAAEVADLIGARQAKGKSAVLGLATGSTPVPVYRELVRLHRKEGLSFRNVVTFNLDEYYPLPRGHRESYRRFMQDQLFDLIDISPENTHVPPSDIERDTAGDFCREYEAKIKEAGGIDLQILGIGHTGHIGFNEPGSSRDSLTRLITLDRLTRRDAARDFLGEANVPHYAITMGVGTIMNARRIILMAWGASKAEIVAQAVEGAISESVAASFLQEHENDRFVISQISGGKRYDLSAIGRRLANATFFTSHQEDEVEALTFAVDLTPLLKDDSSSLEAFTLGLVDAFREDVAQRLRKFL